jgi:hypothetical protein
MTLSLNVRNLDQRSIYLFLALKGLSARAVSDKLLAVLGANAIASSTVTMSLRQALYLYYC